MSSLQERLMKIANKHKKSSKSSSSAVGDVQTVESGRAGEVGRNLEKRPATGADEGERNKRSRVEATQLAEGVSSGVPAAKFILPAYMGNKELINHNTVVQVSPADEAIINDMGPESLKNEIVADTVSVLHLLEVDIVLNGRESKYLEAKEKLQEKVADLEGKLASLKTNFASYKEKYQLQAGLITTLDAREAEIVDLKKEKIALEEALKKAQEGILALEGEKDKLEGLLKSLETRPVGETSMLLDETDELASMDKSGLIAKIHELEEQMFSSAQESFDNAVAQVKCLNPDVKLKTNDMGLLMVVKDGQLTLLAAPAEGEDI